MVLLNSQLTYTYIHTYINTDTNTHTYIYTHTNAHMYIDRKALNSAILK